jgi:AraC-like DNA-binding protein
MTLPNAIPEYNFHKTKYGAELLIDVVALKDIKKYLPQKLLHRLTYYDITFITEGEGHFSINEQEYPVKTRDVIFTRPGDYRQWDVKGIKDGVALIFEEEFLLTFFNDMNFLKNIAFFNAQGNRALLSLNEEEYLLIYQLLGQIKKEISNYQHKDKHLLRAILYQVLKYLDRIYSEKTPCQPNHIVTSCTDRFMELLSIEGRVHHSTSFYANKLCITPNYLNERIKNDTGIPVTKHIQHALLIEAKKLLLYTDHSINEIGMTLGFEDTSYFIRFFRKLTKKTPGEFRRKEKP